MASIVGVGAVMVFSAHPRALAEWYEDVLGIETSLYEPDGFYHGEITDRDKRCVMRFGILPHKGHQLVAKQDNTMVNYQVDDFDRFVERLKARNVAIDRTEQRDEGRFAYITDPDGHRIELWSER